MLAIIQPLCQDHKYVQVIHCTSNQGQGLGFIKLSIKREEAVVSSGLNYYITGMYLCIISIEYCTQAGAEHSLLIPYIYNQQLYREIPVVTCLVKKGYAMWCYVMF